MTFAQTRSERTGFIFMANLLFCEYHLLALREFGAVTIGWIDVQIGDIYGASSGNSVDWELFDVAVVDVTEEVITLRAVRS